MTIPKQPHAKAGTVKTVPYTGDRAVTPLNPYLPHGAAVIFVVYGRSVMNALGFVYIVGTGIPLSTIKTVRLCRAVFARLKCVVADDFYLWMF